MFVHKKTLPTRVFKSMRAFSGFKIENWCMEKAYVDELANDKDVVKYLLVRQYVFDRTIDAKGLNTRDSMKKVRVFLTMMT